MSPKWPNLKPSPFRFISSRLEYRWAGSDCNSIDCIVIILDALANFDLVP
jgi:hypothetical protein